MKVWKTTNVLKTKSIIEYNIYCVILKNNIKKKTMSVENILADDKNRYVLFPIKYQQIWKMYKKAVASFWTPDEISFSDTNEWDLLSENEKYFIKHVLAFFAGSDGIVMENLATKFYNEVTIPEAKAFYSFQMAIESIHSETYSLLIDTYVSFIFCFIKFIKLISKG